jgi:nucleoside-diphosphate-sugar epimerase
MGTLIAERLRSRGDHVRLLDTWKDPNAPSDIEVLIGDVRDRVSVSDAMVGVDVVHHAAALVPLTKSGDRFWEVNVDGSRIVAEEAVRAGVDSFVQISSSAVYGRPVHPPVRPDTPPNPVEIYGRAKLAGEHAAESACVGSDCRLLIIRPRTILGRGRLGLYQLLFEWIHEGRNFYVIGSGNNAFQYVHANDLMDAYLLLLDKGRAGIHAVGTDRFGTFRQGLETLIEHAGTQSRIKSLPAGPAIATLRLLDVLRLSPLAPWHYLTSDADFYCDVQPLLDLGWAPRYSNDEMLAECYDWFLANAETLSSERMESAHRRAIPEGFLKLVKRLS